MRKYIAFAILSAGLGFGGLAGLVWSLHNKATDVEIATSIGAAFLGLFALIAMIGKPVPKEGR